jgi:hypothetical protein
MLDIIGIHEEAFSKDLCDETASSSPFRYFR